MAEDNGGILNTTVIDREKFNVIGPDVVAEITPLHKRVVSHLKLSPNPAYGDVYALKGKADQLALTKDALMKIAKLAGVAWNYAACKTIQPAICQFCRAAGPSCLQCKHHGTIAYKVVGLYPDAVGQWLTLVGTAEVDPSERTGGYSDKDKKNEGERMREFLLRHVEARAFNAATRTLGVKQWYSPQELAKPFVVVRTYFDPYSDPDLKKFLFAREAARINAMLGRPGQDPVEIEAGENVVKMLKGPQFTEVMRDMEASVAESVDVQTGEIVPAPAQAPEAPYQPEACPDRQARGMPVVGQPAQAVQPPPQSPVAMAMNRGDLLNQLNLLHREWYPTAPGIQMCNHLKKTYGPVTSAMTDLNDSQLREQIAVFTDRIAQRKAAVDAQPQLAEVAA